MRTKLLWGFFLFVSCIYGQAQITFQKTYGGTDNDNSRHAIQTKDGGYIIAGDTRSYGTLNNLADVYVIKVNSEGDTMWTKTYGTTYGEMAKCIQQTSDGGFIVTGIANMNGPPYRTLLLKIDSIGNLMWAKQFGSNSAETGYSVKQAIDGGFIIAGYSVLGGSGDMCLIKTNSVGDTLWTKTYGSTGMESGWSVDLTKDSGYVILGLTEMGAGLFDVYLVKTDSIGNVLWSKTYGGTDREWGNSIQQTSDGGFILAGTNRSFDNCGMGGIYLIKTDSYGDTLWTKNYNCGSGLFARETDDMGFIVCGCKDGNIFLLKTDSLGNIIWAHSYGGTDLDCGGYPMSVYQTNDKGYIIAGETQSFGTGLPKLNFYLIKTDSIGNSGCNQTVLNLIATSTATIVTTVTSQVFSGLTVYTPSMTVKDGVEITALCLTIPRVHELEKKQETMLYPNPFQFETTLKTNENLKDATLTMYNTLGQKIKEIRNISGYTIKIYKDNLQNGIYFIRLTQDNKTITRDKLIITD